MLLGKSEYISNTRVQRRIKLKINFKVVLPRNFTFFERNLKLISIRFSALAL